MFLAEPVTLVLPETPTETVKLWLELAYKGEAEVPADQADDMRDLLKTLKLDRDICFEGEEREEEQEEAMTASANPLPLKIEERQPETVGNGANGFLLSHLPPSVSLIPRSSLPKTLAATRSPLRFSNGNGHARQSNGRRAAAAAPYARKAAATMPSPPSSSVNLMTDSGLTPNRELLDLRTREMLELNGGGDNSFGGGAGGGLRKGDRCKCPYCLEELALPEGESR